MIVSISGVSADETEHLLFLAAWSDMVTMDHPPGLIECWLTKGDDRIEVVALWQDRDTHDAAAADRGSHPADRVFDSTDATARHELLNVMGRITP
jgi:hypothetical protein